MSQLQALDMSDAAFNVVDMSKMIQIRNVPDDLHRQLKVRAAAEGMTLSDFIKRELSLGARRSTIREIAARTRSRPQTGVNPETTVEILRESRGE
jgi:plasmid stability protein